MPAGQLKKENFKRNALSWRNNTQKHSYIEEIFIYLFIFSQCGSLKDHNKIDKIQIFSTNPKPGLLLNSTAKTHRKRTLS